MKQELATLLQVLFIFSLLQLNVNTANASITAILSYNGTSILILLDRNVEVVNTSNNIITTTNNTSSEEAFKTIFNAFWNFINYIIQNILSLIAIVFLIMICYWMRRDESMLILPFEVVNSENNYNGKAVSDILVAPNIRE
jgi:hypothetical protein